MKTQEEKKLIILVEDDQVFAESVKTKLENDLGLIVMHFGTGEEMLDHLAKNPSVLPEIFILGYNLNNTIASAKNGGKILQELVALYTQKKLRQDLNIIILSDSNERKEINQLFNFDATCVILKTEEGFYEKLKIAIDKILKIEEIKAIRKHYLDKVLELVKELIDYFNPKLLFEALAEVKKADEKLGKLIEENRYLSRDIEDFGFPTDEDEFDPLPPKDDLD